MLDIRNITIADSWTSINGQAELLLGDCRQILPQLPDACVEIVITSPPYNLVQDWITGGPTSSMKNVEQRLSRWYDDRQEENTYQAQQEEVLSQCLRVAVSSVFYNHKVRYAWKRRGCIYHPLDWLRSFPIWTEIIWDRCGCQGGNSNRYLLCDERVYQLRRPRKWHGCMGWTSVWRIPPDRQREHVCPFPQELVRRCLLPTTDPGDVICDPYCGQGTVGEVCLETGRRFIGIEIDPDYFEKAKRRLQRASQSLFSTGDCQE